MNGWWLKNKSRYNLEHRAFPCPLLRLGFFLATLCFSRAAPLQLRVFPICLAFCTIWFSLPLPLFRLALSSFSLAPGWRVAMIAACRTRLSHKETAVEGGGRSRGDVSRCLRDPCLLPVVFGRSSAGCGIESRLFVVRLIFVLFWIQ